ncbi:MAG: DUF6273 domain-containing protein [Roseburia sp.]|nr:DUF6273 domain-containing protein [Roseburia sp.]MCM1277997.1 DUF6273 domain-containing protein [Robinsoniella sp.]
MSEKESMDNISNTYSGNNSKTGNGIHAEKTIAASIIAVVVIWAAILLIDYSGNIEGELSAEGNKIPATMEVGDTITFGTYNDEAIEWRVLKLSDDGKEAVLISKKLLCMKAYDAAESGKFSYDKEGNLYLSGSAADIDWQLQVQVRGNSDWSLSNIRTWLNSSDEVVKYEDQAPVAAAMSEGHNAYSNEPGFLYGFTKQEMELIKEVENVTAGNGLSGQEAIVTKDKVYLLSLEELKWFEDADMSLLAEPTQKAVANDGTKWYWYDRQIYSVKTYYWWLREPVKEASGKCYTVGSGKEEENIYKKNVAMEGFGIRPAITIYVGK